MQKAFHPRVFGCALGLVGPLSCQGQGFLKLGELICIHGLVSVPVPVEASVVVGASVPVETLLVVGPPVVVEASRVEVPASVVLPGTEVRPSLAQALRAYLTMASASLPDGVPAGRRHVAVLGLKGRLRKKSS